MESSDVFSQQKTDDTDPFAGSDFGDWEPEGGRDPSEGQTPTPVEPLPPAAAEGPVPDAPPAVPESAPPAPQEPAAPVSAPPAPPPPPSPSQAAAEGIPAGPQAASAAPPPAPVPQAPPEPPPAASSGPERSPAASSGPERSPAASSGPEPFPVAEEAERRQEEGDVPIAVDPQPSPAGATSNGSSPSSEPELSFPPAAETAAPSTAPSSAPATPSSPDSEAAPEAEMPEETKDKRGRVTHRRYVILRHDGNSKYTQLDWYEDKQHKLVPRNTSGAKRQNVVLARGTEEALKFGYAVVDSPPKGAPLVAVAAAYFQVRHVAPEPPEPMRQKLKIT